MKRTGFGKRFAAVLAAGILLGTIGGTMARGEEALQGAARPNPGLKAALAWAARVDVLDSAGKTLRTVNGTLLQQGVVVQTSALGGASKVRITARDGNTWESANAVSANGLIGLSLLQLPEGPPAAVVFPANTSYMAHSRVFLLNGPGTGPDSLSARIYQNFMLRGAPDLCPTDIGITGAAPAVDSTGRFLGVACDLSEGVYKLGYIVPSGSVQVLTTSPPELQPVSSLAEVTQPGFQDRSTATGLLFRGVVLAQINRPDDARHFLSLALDQDASLPEAHFWTGRILFGQEQFTQASEEFQIAGTKDPSYYLAWHMAGATLHQAKDYAGAVKMYMKALETKPNAADTYCNLGGAYYVMQRVDEAAAAFRKSIELDPRYAQGLAYTNLGAVLNGAGRKDEAEKVYQDLLKVSPDWGRQLRAILDGQN
jgi:tetratricopeptide (TPR) repeat protein